MMPKRLADLGCCRPRHWLAAAMLVAAGCGGGDRHAAAPAAPPLAVSIASAGLADMADRYEVGGVVQARQTATITSRVMSPVRSVAVAPGDTVRSGQVLVSLDVREVAAQARLAASAVDAAGHGTRAAEAEADAAAAALALSQASYDRIAGLVERKSATPQELDEVTASLRSSRARVASAKARLAEAGASVARAQAASEAAAVSASYGVIVAPFAGRITEKLVEPGNMASPGLPLVRMESTDGFRVHVRLDESRAAGVAPGQKVDVLLSGPGDERRVEGTVAEVARAIASDARAFLVKVDLPASAGADADLRSGAFARVRFPGPSRESLFVPGRAVIRRGQVATLFVVEKDIARLRIVRTGLTVGDQVEILAGIDAGERIVVAPPAELADGRAVRVADERKDRP